jgi:hypothetical protein
MDGFATCPATPGTEDSGDHIIPLALGTARGEVEMNMQEGEEEEGGWQWGRRQRASFCITLPSIS